MKTFNYGIDRLTPGLALDICRGSIRGELTRDTVERVLQCRAAVNDIVSRNITVYGINTGFGPLCTTLISDEDTRKLQHNLLLSHAVGVGDLIPEEIGRDRPDQQTTDHSEPDIQGESSPERLGAFAGCAVTQCGDALCSGPPQAEIDQPEIAQQQPGNCQHAVACLAD